MSDYGIAQLCLNGHLITSKSNDTIIKQNFCSQCGEKTISQCQDCNTPIKGSYRQESQIDPPFRYSNAPYIRTSYCYNCGKPFPWTQQTKDAAFELINLAEDLDDTEKGDLKNSINDLIKDSPKTVIAQTKFKKYVAKAGQEIAKGLRDILIDVVSESVKKTIWPN